MEVSVLTGERGASSRVPTATMITAIISSYMQRMVCNILEPLRYLFRISFEGTSALIPMHIHTYERTNELDTREESSAR